MAEMIIEFEQGLFPAGRPEIPIKTAKRPSMDAGRVFPLSGKDHVT